MANTQILLIRHGETPWNRIKRMQGHIDIPLADTGVAQARQLAERLAREARDGARLDAIYSSDLLRAQQTAAPLAEALGLQVQLREGLRERHYGEFQGYDYSELAERFPVAFAAWQTRDPDFAPAGGESQRAFFARVIETVKTLAGAHRGGRIACVAHGGVLDCVYRYASGLALEMPRQYALLNTSINVVDFDDERAQVLQWADVGHLSDASDDDGYLKVV
jgi:2,3-bisphosphoglycerate-dependent phosphoglycerate mutase